MNLKIQQLINRSLIDEQAEVFSPEKLANLIIKECIKVVRETTLKGSGVDPDTFTGTVTAAEKIKHHFGINDENTNFLELN